MAIRKVHWINVYFTRKIDAIVGKCVNEFALHY
jgi:hypothetical protein